MYYIRKVGCGRQEMKQEIIKLIGYDRPWRVGQATLKGDKAVKVVKIYKPRSVRAAGIDGVVYTADAVEITNEEMYAINTAYHAEKKTYRDPDL
jgi:hypothetical protein